MNRFKFIGWCNSDGHDKVWAVLELQPHRRYATIWGRRGKTLQSKIMDTSWHEVQKLIGGKLRKDYMTSDLTNLARVYPEFEADLEKTAFWAILKG